MRFLQNIPCTLIFCTGEIKYKQQLKGNYLFCLFYSAWTQFHSAPLNEIWLCLTVYSKDSLARNRLKYSCRKSLCNDPSGVRFVELIVFFHIWTRFEVLFIYLHLNGMVVCLFVCLNRVIRRFQQAFSRITTVSVCDRAHNAH